MFSEAPQKTWVGVDPSVVIELDRLKEESEQKGEKRKDGRPPLSLKLTDINKTPLSTSLIHLKSGSAKAEGVKSGERQGKMEGRQREAGGVGVVGQSKRENEGTDSEEETKVGVDDGEGKEKAGIRDAAERERRGGTTKEKDQRERDAQHGHFADPNVTYGLERTKALIVQEQLSCVIPNPQFLCDCYSPLEMPRPPRQFRMEGVVDGLLLPSPPLPSDSTSCTGRTLEGANHGDKRNRVPQGKGENRFRTTFQDHLNGIFKSQITQSSFFFAAQKRKEKEKEDKLSRSKKNELNFDEQHVAGFRRRRLPDGPTAIPQPYQQGEGSSECVEEREQRTEGGKRERGVLGEVA
ncbi:hypothetical protein BLNAU_20006 [Blattamonas nauphoetae]|uniref:Uncharacterized protein n=1 Tax=Blattamonas nauphoetae TaxID=2049346 RepID=A0ABQ9WZU2_9EUKA|nr:hypothetical protein BLNAU_20006 [Blattamonas nauphoetae]